MCITDCILVFVERSRDHRDLHSFPTRRSSDLRLEGGYLLQSYDRARAPLGGPKLVEHAVLGDLEQPGRELRAKREARRSEEHTSELQSLRHLVCRRLLEKKNNTRYPTHQRAHR